mmetsp:Transcript_32225/g.70316  ORF Transcript_32225/g.70316 Transcript_32225/m.70316 type:complete len:208 (+) Transcript_32225:181-804(+)|eukprot:CAMPEP_0118934552 /NCGR_PEP_ID=MMETSP1169-20130426/13889_1 /TAXON_ID=36882 /ORGANISM="Pyramimonas obovata, Strain CCMP722" /LENGTH=207 /DNA_ID=CAMNT_0006877471 /DNA_START=179 /DNA_END=802 /DNA_ORIENTATION=+
MPRRHRKGDKYAVRPGSAKGGRPKSASGRPRTAEATPAYLSDEDSIRGSTIGSTRSSIPPTPLGMRAHTNPLYPGAAQAFQGVGGGQKNFKLEPLGKAGEDSPFQPFDASSQARDFGFIPGTQFRLPGHEYPTPADASSVSTDDPEGYDSIDDLEQNGGMPDASSILVNESSGVRYMKYMKVAFVGFIVAMLILSLRYTVLKKDMKG